MHSRCALSVLVVVCMLLCVDVHVSVLGQPAPPPCSPPAQCTFVGPPYLSPPEPLPSTVFPTDNSPPPGWSDPSCTDFFIDASPSSGCCATLSSPSYGVCLSSGEETCPGTDTTATCNSASTNIGPGNPQCPFFTNAAVPGGFLYPKCGLANPACKGPSNKCWGIVECYLTPKPVVGIDSPVPCDNVFSIKMGQTFNYPFTPVGPPIALTFCFSDGNSDNAKWCGIPGAVVRGDPQFSGFQGQTFQFHGLADEVFNLISSPSFQLNGHFVYLASGKCDYNNTMCFQHPGTYIDQLGFSFHGERQITLVAGSHEQGLFASINGEIVDTSVYKRYSFTSVDGEDVTVAIESHDQVTITTANFIITVTNSDMFFNLQTTMLDRAVLTLGHKHHSITDHVLCQQQESSVRVSHTSHPHPHVHQHKHSNMSSTALAGELTHQHEHGQIEALLQAKYGGAQVALHGLIGQTWRNALVCGKHYVGVSTDYVASSLHSSDYLFNFYQREVV